MPRSQSLEEQPSTSGARSPDDVRPASTDGRSHRKQKKLSKLGRSFSTPVATKSEQSSIELLNPKPNGTTMDESSEDSHENKTPIRWMWRKALKSLKTKDKDKMKESDKGTDKDEKKAYSRMNSRQSSLKKGLLKRKDSKEQPATEEEPEVTDEAAAPVDPVFVHLKYAAVLKKTKESSPTETTKPL